MVRNLFIVLTVLFVFGTLSANAQSKASPAAASDNDRMAMSVDLAGEKPCGGPTDGTAVFVGTVVKRDFAEDEVTLAGVVLRDAKDRRTLVNIDSEHLKNSTSLLSEDLSDLLTVGKRVRIKADRCGRVYVARRLLSSR